MEDVINDRLIKATIATGECKGRTVLIPKILIQPADENQFGFEWQRLQFPIRLAFAITIHKSQGQTLEKVVVWLQEPCFGHGQLYVGAFREYSSIVEVLERSGVTELTASFKCNSEYPETRLPYIKFPEQFVFDEKK